MTDREKVLQALEHCDLCSDMPNCPGCAYLRKPDCMEHLKRDIIALLKEQEPRVMKVTEVSACEVGTVLWVEERQGVTWNLFPLEIETSSTHPDTGTDYLFFITYHDLRKFECSEYNQTWRCWTSRPTDEEREATPWQVCM